MELTTGRVTAELVEELVRSVVVLTLDTDTDSVLAELSLLVCGML